MGLGPGNVSGSDVELRDLGLDIFIHKKKKTEIIAELIFKDLAVS